MAAISEEKVRQLINEMKTELETKWGTMLESSRVQIATEIRTHREEFGIQRAEILDQKKRIHDLITTNNTRIDEVTAEILKHRAEMVTHEAVITQQQSEIAKQNQDMGEHQNAILAQHQRATQALDETQQLDQRMRDVTSGLDANKAKADELFTQVDGLIGKVRTDTAATFQEVMRRVELLVDGAKTQMGAGGSGTHGVYGGGKGKGSNIDKKEVAVWKLPE